ncbi:hypothetical protein OIE62_26865 [Streptomyces scopuliridis]|uniref:Uncharacterized protein n=1 Tax=Streptomyces scopuliridis TaxID=452529 RepID=A0ACD4ZIM4_9ACTN|nr:hypothetical protein [Streptomyces scopuliridis]WSB33765.1 hypothetical protein OG949_13365 [Streptomyces scopuliridis]WSB98038.1 hypothetical protein OG835_14075 [Streptomyces scopuliridis]WSC08260.1 hypothetical protein OIE62_26865 [Streptomyces scopuliridis]
MYATQAMAFVAPLAKELDENKVTPGVLGFIVFAVMAGGVWMLMKSMNRHMSMVNFEETPAQTPAASAQSSKQPAENEPTSAASQGE